MKTWIRIQCGTMKFQSIFSIKQKLSDILAASDRIRYISCILMQMHIYMYDSRTCIRLCWIFGTFKYKIKDEFWSIWYGAYIHSIFKKLQFFHRNFQTSNKYIDIHLHRSIYIWRSSYYENVNVQVSFREFENP